ncbi:MAG: amidohydrolase family protein [Parahaliea sp.]
MRIKLPAILTGLLITTATTLPAQASNTTTNNVARWNVNQPAYSAKAKTVTVDTTEGTWMNLDVSPDGRQIVFDLMGDLYLLPIEGGEAHSLTSGHAWDMQPRFSPDGKQIAFTSDRAGGDNIWTLHIDSKACHQVTHENFRLLNNPSWSPDGQYIVARKHFTTSRSLGTGEIWLYAANGGDKESGQQVVERPGETFQKEQGEPIFTADGRGIYFTLNTTPGNTFIYHQDSNTELFQIRRIDLDSGNISTVVGGPGGAVRPTPSPDGRYLAYIKRVRTVPRLFVMDLDSGESRMVHDALDMDMQETWAVHGLYPNFDWTPDSQQLVFWAGGKLHKLSVNSGQLSNIPFHVKDRRDIYPAPRFKVDVAPDHFPTRMVRFAQPSPDGRAVVFESLGRLYIQRGDNTPKLLGNDQHDDLKVFDYAPVWAPDGTSIYFLRWHDQTLSSIHQISINGGKSRPLGRERGKFTELAIDASGKTLAYRKHEADTLLNPTRGVKPGIYLLDIASGKSHFVSERGTNPHFGSDISRLYVQERTESATGRGSHTAITKLLSMTRSGFDIREIARATHATAIKMAPDDRHVAYEIAHQMYVSNILPSGKPVILDAAQTAFPSVQLSKTGGTYLYWNSDGSALSWSVGPQLKTVSLATAFKPDYTPPEQGKNLSIKVKSAKPDSKIALVNARIITMDTTRRVIDKGTVLIDGNRITQLGNSEAVNIPAAYQHIDFSGKTLMPGMVDIHAHGPYGFGEIVPRQNWNLLAHLALGVTTVHNPSSVANLAFAAAEYRNAGLILGPRIFSTAEVIYGAHSTYFSPVNSLEDALAHVRRLKAQGAISVKNYNQPRREQRQQVIEAARQEGLMSVAEGGSLYQLDMSLVGDGISGIEHNIPVMPLYDDVLQFWRASDAGYTPTLVVTFGGLTSEDYYYQDTDVWKHPILANFVPPSVLQPRAVRRPMAPEADYRDDDAAAAARLLLKEGVMVNIGGHGQREGLASHWEMWSFVRGGFTTMEALAAATINPAVYMGMSEDVGSLEAGKLADLVVLNDNPLEDIRNSDHISHIILNGRIYTADNLSEQYTGDAKLAPFYWQKKAEAAIR